MTNELEFSTAKFVKTSVYHSAWTFHIFASQTDIESVDHCALWCRIQPYTNNDCQLFYHDAGSNTCYIGDREVGTYTGGPRSSSKMDVYWDPGKFNLLIKLK